MTTKRKVRRPRQIDLWDYLFVVDDSGERDGVWLRGVDADSRHLFMPLRDIKRLIRWLTQAVKWLEQEEGK